MCCAIPLYRTHVILAKEYAKRLRSNHKDKDYANHNPCTRVDLLVEELENPLSVLKNK